MTAPLIDVATAAAVARRLAPPGPAMDPAAARAAVEELRALAVEVEPHVRAVTQLVPDVDPVPAVVVDREAWVRANASALATALAPLADKQRRPFPAVASRVTGAQTGTLLAWLSTKVLGQYDVLGGGGLLVVAPNVVEAERAMGVDPRDFRTWVVLHEVAHRTQFTAVPWLADHVVGEVHALLEAAGLDDPSVLAGRLKALVSEVPRGRSLAEALQPPAARAVVDRMTGLMSLLEGHAEFVMDAVGPEVVPTVAVLRARFQERRAARSGLVDRLLRQLLGLDLKALQYAEGSRFVREVVDAVGVEGLNAAWQGPASLPTIAEVRAPATWLARVHG